ncbi:MAG: hypothetical protein RMK74_07160 [Myxococcales bacterium]|nr:hypothetical protein [Myxococcales bacterium]
MSRSIEFRETMRGSYHLNRAPGQERPIALHVRARTAPLSRFLFDPVAEIDGEIDAPGLASHRPMRGSLEIDPLRRRRIGYDVRFEDDEGRPCRLYGAKELELMRLHSTLTTLPASLWREDEPIGRALLRFDLRADLGALLRSIRVR